MKQKHAFLIAALVILTAAGGFAYLKNNSGLRSTARRAWKERALATIARKTADSGWLSGEIGRMRNSAARHELDSGPWLSKDIVLMKNGDWIVYANRCVKEDWRISDIFIGRGSDGKWYYSTYHFCVGMLALRTEEQPANLAHFAETYFLREFDGRSDECLRRTWPSLRP
jgi:hypothetical protein